MRELRADTGKDTARTRTRTWARRNGIVPQECELCGVTQLEIMQQATRLAEVCRELGAIEPESRKRFFVAHHWRGYEYHEDVWWICYSCNRKLMGRHDGSMDKSAARQFVKSAVHFGGGWRLMADRESQTQAAVSAKR